MKELQEGDLVLCTVKKIVGTTVFVEIDGNGEGTINVSEVSPGRIRNLRDYVVPNKKIVCKILRIEKGGQKNVTLSLRRVTQKETKEVMSEHKKEKSSLTLLKTFLKDETENTVEKIKSEYKSLSEFLQEARNNEKLLNKFMSEQQAHKLFEVLKLKKIKKIEIKKEIKLSSNAPDGIKQIQKILDIKNVNIYYLGSGKYTIKIEGKDFKEIKIQMNKILQNIEEQAKKSKMEFELKDK